MSNIPRARRSSPDEPEALREENAELRKELEEINRGLIALYAELEDARQADALRAAIVRSSDDAIFSLTADLVIDSWNPGAERLLGYTSADVLGQPIDILVPGRVRGELDVALKRLRAGERAVRYDTWHRRRDGSLVEVAVTLSAIRDSGDRLVGHATVLSDLTDRRRTEAEFAAVSVAQEVLAARDRIARDVHDGAIQSIFAVGMRLQATATMSQDAVVRERLEAMVIRLDAVIHDLRRHIFGIRAGVVGDLSQALHAIADEIAGQRAMRVSVEVNGDVAILVEEHSDDLTHLVREALSNASRHGQASTGRVSLRSEGRRAVLEIHDDGVGFDVEGASRHGHGLENFRWRAERMAGEVEVTSIPGGGTTVRFSLPI